MSKTTIQINNVWSIARNLPHNAYHRLYDKLSYEVIGSNFVIDKAKRAITEEEKTKYEKYLHWDGRKHLVRKVRGEENSIKFLTGLTSRVYSTLVEEFNTLPDILDKRIKPEKNLFLKWNEKIIPREYQLDAVSDSLKKTRGVLELCTGAGKTLIASRIIYEIKASPFIFYVLTKDLMEQAKCNLEEYMPGVEVGEIGDGKCNIKDINVMTIQTAYRCYEKPKKDDEKENFLDLEEGDIRSIKKENLDHLKKRNDIKNLIENCKGIYFDEAHHSAANTCQKIMEHSKNAYYIFGGTATPERADNADLMIEGIFGRKIGSIDASFLIDKGYLVPPDINFINLKTKKSRVKTYAEDYKKHIIENKERNKYIVDIANHMRHANIPTLILVQRINHGEILEKLIPESVFIQGKSKNRSDAIQEMRDGRRNIMIATTLADEGLDISRLTCLIMAGGGKSPIKCKQRVGRVIRKCEEENKKSAIVYDFNDIGRWISSHSNSRKKILKAEKRFNVKNIDNFEFSRKKTIF